MRCIISKKQDMNGYYTKSETNNNFLSSNAAQQYATMDFCRQMYAPINNL